MTCGACGAGPNERHANGCAFEEGECGSCGGDNGEHSPDCPWADDPDEDEDAPDPNDCAECARSYGPHYSGPCEHGGAIKPDERISRKTRPTTGHSKPSRYPKMRTNPKMSSRTDSKNARDTSSEKPGPKQVRDAYSSSPLERPLLPATKTTRAKRTVPPMSRTANPPPKRARTPAATAPDDLDRGSPDPHDLFDPVAVSNDASKARRNHKGQLVLDWAKWDALRLARLLRAGRIELVIETSGGANVGLYAYDPVHKVVVGYLDFTLRDYDEQDEGESDPLGLAWEGPAEDTVI